MLYACVVELLDMMNKSMQRKYLFRRPGRVPSRIDNFRLPREISEFQGFLSISYT